MSRGETALLTDGFALLRSLSYAELERRIDYLESALNAYRVALAVKRAMESCPPELEIPTEWVSAVDLAREEAEEEPPAPTAPSARAQAQARKRFRDRYPTDADLDEALVTVLQRFPEGLSFRALQNQLGLANRVLVEALDRAVLVECRDSRWVYCGVDAPTPV